jgi:hypothetical protein
LSRDLPLRAGLRAAPFWACSCCSSQGRSVVSRTRPATAQVRPWLRWVFLPGKGDEVDAPGVCFGRPLNAFGQQRLLPTRTAILRLFVEAQSKGRLRSNLASSDFSAHMRPFMILSCCKDRSCFGPGTSVATAFGKSSGESVLRRKELNVACFAVQNPSNRHSTFAIVLLMLIAASLGMALSLSRDIQRSSCSPRRMSISSSRSVRWSSTPLRLPWSRGLTANTGSRFRKLRSPSVS